MITFTSAGKDWTNVNLNDEHVLSINNCYFACGDWKTAMSDITEEEKKEILKRIITGFEYNIMQLKNLV